MKKRILSLLFLLFCFIVSAQDCNSLRKPNETYGLGEGKDASWCNMQNPTAYTDCMCKQEKASQVTAAQQQELQNKALQKSTEASSLYQQAHNLATQAGIGKDSSKLDKAKKLYQQAIALSNEAKGYIEQAYAGADASYTNLKNLYLEQYDKQIAWATTGIDNIASQKERIKAETNKKQIKLTPTKASASNNWDLKNDTKTDNSWASDDAGEQSQKDNRVSSTGKHYIGEKFGGGIVVQLDDTKEHGLIMGLKCMTWEPSQSYYDYADKYDFIYSDSDGDDRFFSVFKKLNEINTNNYNGFSDWILPDFNDLTKISMEQWFLILESMYPKITDPENEIYVWIKDNDRYFLTPNLHGKEIYSTANSTLRTTPASHYGILTSTIDKKLTDYYYTTDNNKAKDCTLNSYKIFNINNLLGKWMATYWTHLPEKNTWGYGLQQIPKEIEMFNKNYNDYSKENLLYTDKCMDHYFRQSVDRAAHFRPFRKF